MKTLLISTALFTAPLAGIVSAQATTTTLTKLVSEQERQIQELKSEVTSLRSLLNLERRKNGQKAIPVSTQPTSATPSTYTVKAGDTFSSISRKYGVSVSSMIAANPSVKPSRIAINQKLVIPHANSKSIVATPQPQTAKPAVKLASSETKTISTSGSTYKVSKGDTFYSIAKMHKISLASLTAANPEVNPNKLKIGQSIRLTGNVAQPTPAAPAKKSGNAYKPLPDVVIKATAPTPAPKSTPIAAPAPKTTESYVKQSGDVARTVPVSHEMTFGAFAKQHGTSIAVLNALNGLDLPADEPMAAGSELFIPNQ